MSGIGMIQVGNVAVRRLFGNPLRGATVVALANNQKIISRYPVRHVPARITKLSAYIDGGAGPGAQPARGVVYDSADALVAATAEVVIPGGLPLGWVDFPFETPGGLLVDAAGDYGFGLHAGVGATIRLMHDAAWSSRTNTTDTYADGTAAAFGSLTVSDKKLSVFATFFVPWVAPDEEDTYYGRLPFPEAQAILGASPLGYDPRAATCGWHHTALDPEQGSFCVAASGGPLADLVGERLKFTHHDEHGAVHHVVAYCHNEAELPWDISLTRRLFAELAPLSEDSLEVVVETV